ncbi:sensor histidine kinase [Nocardia sp. NPDC052566]|uniref:sensor histidine kinase n=1 Tax=Nocardia sp. NPDC052566 TaxID=3364330 RepID=UPI0037C71DDC
MEAARSTEHDPGLFRSDLWYRMWVGYEALGFAGAVAVIFLLDPRYPGHPLAATLVLSAMLVWGRSFGRDFYYARELGRRSVVFVCVVIGLFTLAGCLSNPAIGALLIVYPLVLMPVPLRAGAVAAGVVGVIPVAGVLTLEGIHGPDVALVSIISIAGLLVSLVVGTAFNLAFGRYEDLAEVLAELEHSRGEVARLSHDAGTAAERERLAREIHDTLAQGFTSIVTLAQAVEAEVANPAAVQRYIGLIGATAQENLVEARAMVAALTPSALNDGSLVESIRRQGDRLSEETGIAVTVTAESGLPPLSTASEVALLRAAQEAFANVRKHARADAVTVDVGGMAGGVRLSVADNGIGFDPAVAAAGFGLSGMRRRAEQIGALMTVSSAVGGGTTVRIEVPA